MKKMFVTSLLCLMSLNAFSQRPYVIHGTAIEWHVCIVNPHNGSGPLIPKSPALPPQTPEASIDGHTLYLYDVDYDLTLCLLDEDGEEAYTVSVPANTASVVLPATLTGDYELQLYTGGIYYFTGWVEL